LVVKKVRVVGVPPFQVSWTTMELGTVPPVVSVRGMMGRTETVSEL
jgi:hypothetical protein